MPSSYFANMLGLRKAFIVNGTQQGRVLTIDTFWVFQIGVCVIMIIFWLDINSLVDRFH